MRKKKDKKVIAEKIRSQYVEKTDPKDYETINQLTELHKKVYKLPVIVGVILGALALIAIIFGLGCVYGLITPNKIFGITINAEYMTSDIEMIGMIFLFDGALLLLITPLLCSSILELTKNSARNKILKLSGQILDEDIEMSENDSQ